MNNERTVLYRHFDVNDTLLYVGISGDAYTRFKQHRAEGKGWTKESVKMTSEWFGNREQAEEAEVAAIISEHPKHNIRHKVLGEQKEEHYLKQYNRNDIARIEAFTSSDSYYKMWTTFNGKEKYEKFFGEISCFSDFAGALNAIMLTDILSLDNEITYRQLFGLIEMLGGDFVDETEINIINERFNIPEKYTDYAINILCMTSFARTLIFDIISQRKHHSDYFTND